MSRLKLLITLPIDLIKSPARIKSLEFGLIETRLSRVATYQTNVMHRYLLGDKLIQIESNLSKFSVVTQNRIAIDSADHLHPLGVLTDVTHCPQLVNWANNFFNKPKLKFLDLGCAGGGLVCDFILAGHNALGLEGSSVAKISGSGFWPFLKHSLLNADITKPFQVTLNDKDSVFDLITAWEVLEHIDEEDVSGLLNNIKQHLSPTGLFIGSVAQFESKDPIHGVHLHVNLNPKEWWLDQFQAEGFEIVENPPIWAMSRGSGNRTATDWDQSTDPDLGFHISARIKSLY